jgi:hypothetical protein
MSGKDHGPNGIIFLHLLCQSSSSDDMFSRETQRTEKSISFS